MKRSLTSLTLVILLSFLTLAQQPAITSDQKTSQQPTQPSDDVVVRITTNLVQVDAVVTDKPEQVRRTVALVVDDLCLSFESGRIRMTP